MIPHSRIRIWNPNIASVAAQRNASVVPALLLAAVIAATIALYLDWRSIPKQEMLIEERLAAARLMEDATAIIRDYRLSLGIPIDQTLDPNRTGLIGDELTDLTTTLGSLTAKRTSTNSQFAGVVLEMLVKAGVKPGDTVAVNFSGSFPALNIAVLAACKTMNVKPLIVSSVGASAYGANIPRLTWLDMEKQLLDKGLFSFGSAAVSLGGIAETDGGLDGTGFIEAEAAIARHGAPYIDEGARGQLEADILRRQRMYMAGGKPAAYVNVGGPITSLGWVAEAARLDNGLLHRVPYTASPQRGLLFRMFEAGIPVIHILNIERLAARYGLPIDPVPLPQSAAFNASETLKQRWRWTGVTLTVWLVAACLFIGFSKRPASLRK